MSICLYVYIHMSVRLHAPRIGMNFAPNIAKARGDVVACLVGVGLSYRSVLTRPNEDPAHG